ncbi:STAS domain-containing protein [Mycobacterium sp. 21AC1]|uniref:STAS domain-containing protein n=1 Tax=[Mycobacterium] appelbergii TaxID=2939269 RepID=UPI0029390076|nr:STAS domain-containing protein [Mycobacterium sp. 21AC1]MDV3126922.1 STAS domain-containing protein [Mycobacterium sp. 21AC1]
MSIDNVARTLVRPPHDLAGRQTAHFATRWLEPSTAVVSAHGDLDAANATIFTEYSLTQVKHSTRLVLDLTAVTFFGTACFATLHTLNVACAGEGVSWALAPSKEVSRILRICDPDATLPVCTSVREALSVISAEARPLQLISGSD